MTDDEIITLEPGDDDVVAEFAALREHASRFSEHLENDDMFTRMLMHGGYNELLDLMRDYTDNDDDNDDGEIRGYN